MKNMLRPFPLLCILALLWGNTNHNTLAAQTNYGRQGDWFIVNKGDAASLLAAIDAAKTVNGYPVSKTHHGLYIVNGRKVMM